MYQSIVKYYLNKYYLNKYSINYKSQLFKCFKNISVAKKPYYLTIPLDKLIKHTNKKDIHHMIKKD